MKCVILLCAFLISSMSFAANTKSKQPLIIALPDVAPYASAQLANGGFYPELIRTAFERVDYQVEIRFLPFKRILRMLTEGQIAGAGMVSYKAEREAFLIYPKIALYEDKLRVYGLKKGAFIEHFSGLESLKGYTVGAYQGGFVEKELAKLKISYESTASIAQNVHMLIAGRVDFIASPELPLSYVLNNELDRRVADKVIRLDPPFKLDKHYLAFSKFFPNTIKISADFSRGLTLIKAEGTFDKIKKRYF